jgi:uncharacterized protein
MPRVVHFELQADDPQRAVKFYKQVFGWTAEKWGSEEYWLISTGPTTEPGINGGILPRNSPGATTVNTVDVPSLDDAIAKVTAAGGQIALPKQAVPGIGWLAYGIDTEGNLFGMMQADPKAA